MSASHVKTGDLIRDGGGVLWVCVARRHMFGRQYVYALARYGRDVDHRIVSEDDLISYANEK